MQVFEWEALPTRESIPGFRARFVHSARATLARWEISAGATLPGHSHPHEQITWVVEGCFELTVEGVTHVLEAGMTGIVPPGAVHAGKALTPCRIVDVFCPVREDYRSA